MLTRQEYRDLMDVLEAAEKCLEKSNEQYLNVRMQRLRLEQKGIARER